MPGPPLAVLGGFEQFIHDASKGLRRFVCDEGIDFLGCRRDSDQVEVGATNQCLPDGKGSRLDFPGLEFSGDEIVDGIAGPGAVLNRRNRGGLNLLECPVRAVFSVEAISSAERAFAFRITAARTPTDLLTPHPVEGRGGSAKGQSGASVKQGSCAD